MPDDAVAIEVILIGGGGGGAFDHIANSRIGGAGFRGVVAIRYPVTYADPVLYTNGVLSITPDGLYKRITWTVSGQLIFVNP